MSTRQERRRREREENKNELNKLMQTLYNEALTAETV